MSGDPTGRAIAQSVIIAGGVVGGVVYSARILADGIAGGMAHSATILVGGAGALNNIASSLQRSEPALQEAGHDLGAMGRGVNNLAAVARRP